MSIFPQIRIQSGQRATCDGIQYCYLAKFVAGKSSPFLRSNFDWWECTNRLGGVIILLRTFDRAREPGNIVREVGSSTIRKITTWCTFATFAKACRVVLHIKSKPLLHHITLTSTTVHCHHKKLSAATTLPSPWLSKPNPSTHCSITPTRWRW